ncbi:unnamed protein product, partial [Ectocarpus sp. 12 AP-2014]
GSQQGGGVLCKVCVDYRWIQPAVAPGDQETSSSGPRLRVDFISTSSRPFPILLVFCFSAPFFRQASASKVQSARWFCSFSAVMPSIVLVILGQFFLFSATFR